MLYKQTYTNYMYLIYILYVYIYTLTSIINILYIYRHTLQAGKVSCHKVGQFQISARPDPLGSPHSLIRVEVWLGFCLQPGALHHGKSAQLEIFRNLSEKLPQSDS